MIEEKEKQLASLLKEKARETQKYNIEELLERRSYVELELLKEIESPTSSTAGTAGWMIRSGITKLRRSYFTDPVDYALMYPAEAALEEKEKEEYKKSKENAQQDPEKPKRFA